MENETKSLKKTVVINVSKEENVREELVSKESISEITQENLSINEQFDVFKDKEVTAAGQINLCKEEKNETAEAQNKQPLSKSEMKSISRQKKREKRMRFQPKNVLGNTLERSNFHEEFLHKSSGEETPYHSVIMPEKIMVDHFEEIKSMLNAVKQHSGSKTALQLLPNYLRRRAASHNTKRLPRNLRNLAKAQMQSSEDISFLKCLQLSGSNQNLLDTLSSLVLEDEMLSLKTFLTGLLKERELLLYDRVSNPARCVGPAHVMFTPMDEDKSRRVWMWLHPTLAEKVTAMLERSKEKYEITIEDISGTVNRFRLTGPKSSVTLLAVLRLFSHFKRSSSKEDEVEASNLRAWLVEHKTLLRKQHSLFVSVMKDCHNRHFHTEETQSSPSTCNHGDVLSLLVNDPRLTLPVQRSNPSITSTAEPTKHDDVSEFKINLLRKSPLWISSLRAEVSASRLPDHVVSTRKHETKLCVGKELKKLTEEMATPVPVAVIRRSGYQIQSDLVQKNLDDIDCTDANSTEAAAPKQCRTAHGGPPEGFGAGWDIIIPSNWGMAFWVPFVYHQAKPIGMEMHCHGNLEHKTPTFPQDYPDSEAGLDWWMSELQANHNKYYKKPPSKRPNFALLATKCPFAPCWKHLFESNISLQSKEIKEENQLQLDLPRVKGNILVSDNLMVEKSNKVDVEISRKRTHSDDDVEEPVSKAPKIDCDYELFLPFVLRDKGKLDRLDKLIKDKGDENLDVLTSFVSEHKNTLVCMKVTPINRGVPAPQTSISIPESRDLETLQEDFYSLYNNGLRDCFGPKEAKHWDPYRKDRKEATKTAKKNRKRKTANRVKIMRNYPYIFDVPASRKVVGYVTSGNYLFSFAAGGGIAFVSIDALPALLSIKQKHDWLSSFMHDTLLSNGLISLMRNIDSEQYRFITLDLIK